MKLRRVSEETLAIVRRGRPKSERPKQSLNLRLDQDVIDAFRREGPGWQSRMNEALRRAAKLGRRS